jgi:hypothetical protein
MTVVLSEAGAAGAEAVQTGVINGAGLVITLLGVLLTAAWIAFLYR